MVDDTDADDPDAPTTDDLTDTDTAPDQGGSEGATDPDEGDPPALADDEKADVPPSLAEQMAEARDDQPESKDGEANATNDEGGSEGASEGGNEGGSDPDEGGSDETTNDGPGYAWGDVYVDFLAIFLLEVSAELNETGETDMTEDDVRDLASSGPIDLSEAAGDVFDQSGIGDDMTPAQALVTGSAFVAFAVLMQETDAAGELVGRVSQGIENAEIGGAA